MAVIAIRHEFAAGGRELERMLAEKTGYRFVDKYIFRSMAEALSVSDDALSGFEKSRLYHFTNIFLNLISKEYIQRIVGRDRSIVNEKDYRQALRQLIFQVAETDNVVIMGRASCYFLKDYKNCYRFRIYAPIEWRERYAVQKLNVPADCARKVVRHHDKNQRWFLREICGDVCDNRELYHVAVNMGMVSFEKAVEVILSTADLYQKHSIPEAESHPIERLRNRNKAV